MASLPAGRWLIFETAATILAGCVLLGLQYSTDVAASNDRFIVFNEPMLNKSLTHHVIKSEVVPNEGSCRVKCYLEPNCVSINTGPLNSGKIHCELNNATNAGDLTERMNYVYLAIQNPCGNGGIRQAGFTTRGFRCKCIPGFYGRDCQDVAKSCSELKHLDPAAESGDCVIDPDGEGGLSPFHVTCNMTDKDGVGVTVVSHDSESRTLVVGFENKGSYSLSIHYTGVNVSQLASLTTVSLHCEQFIMYECFHARLNHENGDPIGWWVSRDDAKMTYWHGASGSGQCACALNTSCAHRKRHCNCDRDDFEWREDSGTLTNKTHLPVKQLRFGDTGNVTTGGEHVDEKGYHTLGKFKCYGIV